MVVSCGVLGLLTCCSGAGLQADANPVMSLIFFEAVDADCPRGSVWILIPSSSAPGRAAGLEPGVLQARRVHALRWVAAGLWIAGLRALSMVLVPLGGQASAARFAQQTLVSPACWCHDRAGGMGAPPPS